MSLDRRQGRGLWWGCFEIVDEPVDHPDHVLMVGVAMAKGKAERGMGLATPFASGRHQRWIEKIGEIEQRDGKDEVTHGTA